MSFFAVIDTNVMMAALLSKKADSATVKILEELAGGCIIPLYHGDMLEEYREVLQRDKFHLSSETVAAIIDIVLQFGQEISPVPTEDVFPDPDDRIFYEAAIAKRTDSTYLITGNKKHFPIKPFVVTPAEMVTIIQSKSSNSQSPSRTASAKSS